jgi:hypothetical protein
MKGPLILIQRRMNGQQYVDRVLEDKILKAATQIEYNEGVWLFICDGVPCHWAGIAKGFFEKEGIMLMDWPAGSLDFNPIENIWSCLKQAINNRDSIPKTREELIQAIEEEWEGITAEHFNKMIAKMPAQMEACIMAKGGHTKW